MKISSRTQLFWVGTAGTLGFAASSVFSSVLHWRRAWFVLAYGVLVLGFAAAYVRATRIDPGLQLRRRWVSGTIGGLLLGLLLVWNVWSQPGSARPEGRGLVEALVWYGLVYGSIDALLLNVIPVLSIYGTRPPNELQRASPRLRWGLAALAASLVVTAVYHLGFVEYRGPAVLQPLIGNGIITIGYLLTGNPLGAFIPHILMHAAAVVRGMEATVQLPPHY